MAASDALRVVGSAVCSCTTDINVYEDHPFFVKLAGVTFERTDKE